MNTHRPSLRGIDRTPMSGGACRRRGFSLVEVLISGALLGGVMAVTVPTLGRIAAQNRAAGRRQIALEEAQNLMDQLTSLPWEEVTQDRADELSPHPDIANQLPSAELRIEVEEQADPVRKRVRVSLRWNGRQGPVPPVRLTAWTHPRKERP